jgi:hypothetical protein
LLSPRFSLASQRKSFKIAFTSQPYFSDFASKYKLQLPDVEALKAEIERKKQKLLEMKIVKSAISPSTIRIEASAFLFAIGAR